MSKHTPGPWEVLDDRSMTSVVVEYGEICDIVQDGRPASENLANARLIAAAPEMLEALERIRDESGPFNLGEMRKLVESTIQKARGEE